MRKLAVLLAVLFSLTLCSCGDISDVTVVDVPSEIYSERAINSAINTVKTYFKLGWSGCKLTEIKYIGDEYSESFDAWAKRADAYEVIIIVGTFEVDASGGDGSLNPNSTYRNYQWVLARSRLGGWHHIDHGYC